jgi:hypothetical protein
MWQGGKIIIPLLCNEEVMICHQWHGEFLGCGWSHPSNMEDSCMYIYRVIKKSVNLMITIQKVTSNVQSVPCQSPDIYLAQSGCLAADCQGQGYTRLTVTPSVIPNSNYVIMVSD